MVGPEALGWARDQGMPSGTVIVLDPDTRIVGEEALYGGSPPRLLRMSATGSRALAELRAGPVVSPAGAALARRLTDAGLAHPRPGPISGVGPGPLTLTVVVPVRDRVAELEECLGRLGTDHPVLVVDDGSVDPGAVEDVCVRRGALVTRREVNGGPGAARNTALPLVRTDLVAFVDSDCFPSAGWIPGLVGHFADPLVVAVAPRIVEASPSILGSPLDLGTRPGRVAPRSRVPYVPTAALIVRRQALGGGFDETFRYGEDVDLVWRLLEAGWRVRYEPAVQVAHREPASTAGLLGRRFRYGTSAAPLARRHPGQLTHLVLHPVPAATVGALLARRPGVALASFGVGTAWWGRRLRRAGVPWSDVVTPSASGVWQTWVGVGRWGGQFALPVLAALLVSPGGRTARARRGRRLVVGSLLVGPPLVGWSRRRPRGPIVRYCAADLVDNAVYGAGVYLGCWRERLLGPLGPTLAGRRTRRPAN